MIKSLNLGYCPADVAIRDYYYSLSDDAVREEEEMLVLQGVVWVKK